MADIFLQEDITRLLDNRFIVIIGDSIQRAVYKDLVLLLQRNRYLTEGNLRAKGELTFCGDKLIEGSQYHEMINGVNGLKYMYIEGEFTFCGDKLIEGGQYGEMTNGVKYREVRQYQTDYHLVRFYFVTRCYNAYVESIMADISKDPVPDVILMNSCLWDISRYGPNAVEEYKENLATLFVRFNEVLPKSCLVIWNTTLPISKKARGGFLIPAIEFMNNTLRLDILEANFYTHKIACVHGINILDLHYFLRHQLQRRAGDGVHWDMTAHRRMTNLILTHIAQAWNVKMPENAKKILLREQMEQEKNCQNGGQFGNVVDENCNRINRNVRRGGLFDNPNYFKNVLNGISSNFANNLANAYNDDAGYNPVQGNKNGLSGDLIARQQAALMENGSPHTWEPEPSQQQNIERYGGPIRAPDYMDPAAGNQMMLMGNQQCVSNMHWEPYRNEQLNVNMRYGGNRKRDIPYNGGNRGRRNNYW